MSIAALSNLVKGWLPNSYGRACPLVQKKKGTSQKHVFWPQSHRKLSQQLFNNLKDYESANVAYLVVAGGPVCVNGGLPTQESVGCRKEVSMNNTLNPYQL